MGAEIADARLAAIIFYCAIYDFDVVNFIIFIKFVSETDDEKVDM
jgi:hypothetical protein